MILELNQKERRLVNYALTFMRDNIAPEMVADFAEDGFNDETLDAALYTIIKQIWEAPRC